MPQGNLAEQPLETRPIDRAGPRFAQIIVDHDDPGRRPAHRRRPVDQRVLQARRLAMVDDLLLRALPYVDHRQHRPAAPGPQPLSPHAPPWPRSPRANAPPPADWPPAGPPTAEPSPAPGSGAAPSSLVHDDTSRPHSRARNRSTTSTSRNNPSRPIIEPRSAL